MFMTRLL